MKHFFSIAAVVIASSFLLAGNCNKNEVTPCTAQDPALEQDSIAVFNTKNNITAIKHSSGIYYQILSQGTGARPTATSNVRVQYTGTLLNGTVFDRNITPGGASFNLSGVIQGWTIGVPLINSGGVIRLIIPSKFGYGCNASGSIPANSPLYFDISLLAVF